MSSQVTYQEAVAYLLQLPTFTKKNCSEHTKLFLERIKMAGGYRNRAKILHVAGTNGKGSVCAYLDAMLRAQGHTVGLFTSPHLVSITERIQVNGEEISREEFVETFRETRLVVSSMTQGELPYPTFFEFLFGMAMAFFYRKQVEYIVLETGLGGRLDATNVVEEPVCTAISSIGLDHTQYLGERIDQIAAEKAGILKASAPVFYVDSGLESNYVIEEKAKEKKIVCQKIDSSAFEIVGTYEKDIDFSCTNAYYGTRLWRLHNPATYQVENAMLALEVMRYLFREKGKLERWQQALKGVVRPGRMEEIAPHVYVDGAHNPAAIERFVDCVQDKPQKIVILFSAMEDKDYRAMIACLCKGLSRTATCYVVTELPMERGARAAVLGNIFAEYSRAPVIVQENVTKAWEYVLESSRTKTVYCIGSLYLVGKLKSLQKGEEIC